MFKFYSIPSEDIIDKLIGEQATLKLSSAFNLNDPYELKFNLGIAPSAEEHKEMYYKHNPGSSVQDFEDWKDDALGDNGYTWYTEQQIRNQMAQTIALCSFTEKNDNNLMWSHYTNNHKGICIEYKPELFEYLKTLKDYLLFDKVNYSDEPPIVSGLEGAALLAKKIMFNKQSEWKYEKEHRIVFLSDKDTEFISIDRKFIKAVYIGSRADTQIVSKILSVCNSSDIEINYGVVLGKSYQIHFKKHKEGTFYSRAFWR